MDAQNHITASCVNSPSTLSTHNHSCKTVITHNLMALSLIPVDFNLTTISTGLPVRKQLPEITDLLKAGTRSLVIQAPPGTGKTTLIPPLISNVIANTGGKVIVTAPRRMAVRAAAHRLAHLDGSQVGDRVGYAVRGDTQPGQLVEFMTPKILVRRLLRDPELAGVSAVILDEVHERQLDLDLLLGMVVELSLLRPELVVIAMSATVDAQRFAELLAAPTVVTQAETFPITEVYEPLPHRLECSPEFVARVAQLALDHTNEYSTLVFLPGYREVTVCAAELERHTNLPVFTLHGGQTPAEQSRVVQDPRQRIVVATSIAESSLTVPGVRTVIDASLSRVPKRDAMRGMNGLVTLSCSQSSAVQRAGRAGREGPGTVVRCYSQSEFSHFAPHITPEIQAVDLTEFALLLSCWGATPEEFPLLDQPPAAAWTQAQTTLAALGADDPEVAAKLAQLPTDPRLGKALVDFGRSAAETVALLSIGETRGNILAALRRPDARRTQEAKRLQRLVGTHSVPASPGEVVGHAFPQFIARRVGSEYLLAQGTRAQVPAEYGLAGEEWLAIADIRLAQSGRAYVQAAAPLSEAAALDIIGVTEETTYKFKDGRVKGTRVKRAGAITLSSTPIRAVGMQAVPVITEAIATHGLAVFHWSESATHLRERVDFLHQEVGEPWPDVEKLAPELWLQPEIMSLAEGANVKDIDMFAAMQRELPWPAAAKLDEVAPAEFVVPSGRKVPVSYGDGRPTVRVKLQECFGLSASPEFGGRRVLFHLLSPAGRPVAITDDLASFWAGPYQNVRSEMRGRYPKHPWPADPTTAVATARTKH